MPDLPISGLPSVSTLAATDLFAAVASGTTSQISKANVNKKLVNSTAKTSNYNLASGDEVILFDATSGNLTAFLPAITSTGGKPYFIKKTDSSSNTVTVTPDGAETIDGAASKVISVQNGFYVLVSDGVQWRVFASNDIDTGITELTGDVTAGPGSGSQAVTAKAGIKARSFGVTIDGLGSPITPANVGDIIYVPYTGTIIGWIITETKDITGNIVIDVLKSSSSATIPTVSIAGTEKPTLSGVATNQDLTLSTWTTAVTAGDRIRFVVDSASTVERVTLEILITV